MYSEFSNLSGNLMEVAVFVQCAIKLILFGDCQKNNDVAIVVCVAE